ncbi:MAG: right-handed parallel beta-helix repeat-containing protein, partial [Planctomycetes bacterium]|nr:right-handed parallel beta-helix repeat-containing protein [Planctomycetota bacterium]
MQHHHLRRTRAVCAYTVLIGVFLISSAAHGGGVLFVDDDASPGGDGASWNTAYRFLQDALTDASGGGTSEVRVAQGIYKPDRDEANPDGTGDREASFHLLNGVALMGGYAGIGAKDPDARDIELFETILSGDLLGDDEPDFVNNAENTYHVTMGSDTDDTAFLEGFTMTAGNANGDDANERGGGFYASPTDATIVFCKFVANFCSGSGGGLFSLNGSLNLLQTTIVGNRAGGDSPADGGGMALFFSSFGAPTVDSCTFTGNKATNGGGGLVCLGSFEDGAAISNCTFEGNMVTGPSLGAAGGGGITIFFATEAFHILDCTFTNNTVSNPEAAAVGGGLVVAAGSNCRIVNCDFRDNSASRSLASLGGAIHVQPTSSPRFVNCLVAGNSADLGGGINNFGGTATYANCTITGNTAAELGGAFHSHSNSEPLLTNCIVWDNGPEPIVDDDDAMTTVNYSDVQGGWSGEGGNNIDADPMFVAPGNGDYRLSAGSPCIDAGNNWGVPVDVNDYDEDGITNELFPVDLDGNPRFNADENDSDPGCGVPVVVDMGAYEYQFDPVEDVIFADLNGDGSVGVVDLLGLLGGWGPCAKGCCLA